MLAKITVFCLIVVILAGLAISHPVLAESEGEKDAFSASCPFEVQKQNNKSTDISLGEIKEFLADLSQRYGLDYNQLYSVVRCESSFKPQYRDNGRAFGLAQFHLPTFNHYCEGNYYNSFDQLECMAKMFKAGHAWNWTCFNKFYSQVVYRQAGSQTAYSK